MRGVFDQREPDPFQQRRDTELTLGPVLLTGIFLGLALLCAGFFAWGYMVGHRGSQATASAAPPPAVSSSPPDDSQPKPASAPQTAPTQPSTDTNPPAPEPPAEANASSVQPALPAANSTAQPAAAPAWMVQVAAVSRAEDADVLAGALRKRGYPVAQQRDASDSLIHVRIGPFASRDEADKWSLKLLSDGYNAIVQP